MKILRAITSFALIAALAGITGCATEQAAPAKPAPAKDSSATIAAAALAKEKAAAAAAAATKPNDQLALEEGVALYNNGDFPGTIKRLGSATEIWPNGSKQVQLEALKYVAFSYCLTSRSTLCKQQFEKALKLDPNFDLATGEQGHPLWGPIFSRAKKAAAK